jgi:hypothetical protein
MPDIAAVVQRQLKSSARSGAAADPPLRGMLSALPRVGAPLILLVPDDEGGLGRLVTSLVDRVLMHPDGRVLFVETRRSTYRVTLDQPIAALPPPFRANVSFDGNEITVTPTTQAAEGRDHDADAGE